MKFQRYVYFTTIITIIFNFQQNQASLPFNSQFEQDKYILETFLKKMMDHLLMTDFLLNLEHLMENFIVTLWF